MRDPEIVALLADGDPRGLEAAYARYADRIHDYARGMLRTSSPEAAADVTHDTFLIALAKAADLRDRERFRAWLYAIARNECLRVLRTSRRTTPLTDDSEGSTEMSTGIAAAERRALVLAAAEGLAPKDREVFELGMRHDLSAQEIAGALGVSDNAAHALLSRVRASFETALGALLVARQGRGSCAELNEMLAGWDGTYDALWRKRIARHVKGCRACTAVERRELSPAALLAVMPLVPAPLVVRSRLFEDDLDLVAASLAARVAWDIDGFPGVPPARRRRPALLAVIAVLLLLFGVFQSVRLLISDTPEVTSGTPTVTPAGATSPTFSHAFAGTPTLRARPTTASPTPTVTPTTTSAAPTTSAPPVVTPTPTRTTVAPPTTTAPVPGTLRVPTGMIIRRTSGSGTFTIRAVGGVVDWVASVPSGVARTSPASGTLAAGERQVITVGGVGRATPDTFQVIVGPGGHVVNVTVIG